VLPSAEQIKQAASDLFTELAVRNPDIGRLLRRLIPKLRVYPYRLCDGGAMVLRARFTLHLAPLIRPACTTVGFDEVLRREMQVDLVDLPQRVAFREQIVTLRSRGLTESEVARRVGLTVTATQKAAALDRLMKQLGIADPYQPIHEPPPDYGKLRRYLHPRYRFEPLDDESVAS
jgi:site-specific DNA recombinase